MNLKDKKILLGISGGIAAYKAPQLVRDWVRQGAEVEIVLTKSAQEFVTPLALETVAGKQVHQELFPREQYSATVHIDMADWADAVVIAPATANIIAKIRHGIGDDLLTTICLASYYKMMIAPAMNSNMWENPAVQDNLKVLYERGYIIVPPDSGDLACGYSGKGRLPDADILTHWLLYRLNKQKKLKGKSVLVTAGRTEEEFDPVRIITNRSSGKMGFALAREAFYRGADVTLVSGPHNLKVPDGIKYIGVKSAEEMNKAVQKKWKKTDIFVASSAVSDYRPGKRLSKKEKKGSPEIKMNLKANPDILRGMSRQKGDRYLIGFAVETENETENAIEKLKKKKLDLIVVNNPMEAGSGFATDTNRVTIMNGKDYSEKLPLMSKQDVAGKIFDKIESDLSLRNKLV